MPELPRHHTIRESSHRILNPFTPEKLRQLGDALRIKGGATILDLACGKGELLCTWARDYNIRGLGVDISSVFIANARARSSELGVNDRVTFVHMDARGFTADVPADIVSCLGAEWIADDLIALVALLTQSLKDGGTILIGQPYWRRKPTSPEAMAACGAETIEDWQDLPGLIEVFQAQDCDIVEMVLADQDSWDRYVAAQWRNIRQFLDAYPNDDLAPAFREELSTSPIQYTRYQRDHLGWGVFALKPR